MKILLTGFTPFPKHPVNPTESIVAAFQDRDIVTHVFPVAYDAVARELPQLLEQEKPDRILSFGLAGSRRLFSLEQTAYNETKASLPDVAGVLREGGIILPKQPSELSTPFDLRALEAILKKEGFAFTHSTDPGRYLCNDVYFRCLSSGIPSLFVHVPTFENSSLENDVAFAQAILDYLRKTPLK